MSTPDASAKNSEIQSSLSCRNRTQCPVEKQTRALLDKLSAFWRWAEAEPRIVGMVPWHLNDRSQGNPDKDLGLGAVNFPEVLAELKKLNAMISPPALEKESVAVSAEN